MSKRNVGAANNDPRLKKSKNLDVDTTNYHDIRLKETENKKDEKDVITIDNHETNRSLAHADASFARILQEEEYARILQEEEYYKSLSENINEEKAMKDTHSGRAWLFVESALDRHKKLASSPKGRGEKISNIAIDGMVFQAKKLLDCQAEFKRLNISSKVTLGYHYTREQNMDRIKQEGLVTRADQNRVSFGLSFGDGVYVANNPFAFHGKYGNVGILVAVLMGNVERVNKNYYSFRKFETDEVRGECVDKVNTIVGNKKLRAVDQSDIQFYDEIVLQKSCQCLPLVRFSDVLVTTNDDSPNNDAIWSYHMEMQRIVDIFFNDGNKTELVRTFPKPRGLADKIPMFLPPLHISTAAPTSISASFIPMHSQPKHSQQQQHLHQAQHQNMQHQQVNINQSNNQSQSQSQSQSHQHQAPRTQVLSWQSDRDVSDRREMVQKIVRLLQQRKPDAPQEWLKKLPQMAKRLEESLYRSAQSFVEYNDTNTLKFRLQQLAMTIGQKTAAKKNAEEEKHKKMKIARRPAVPTQQNPPPIQPVRTHRVPSVNNSNSILQMPGIDNKITPNDTGLPQVGSNVQGQCASFTPMHSQPKMAEPVFDKPPLPVEVQYYIAPETLCNSNAQNLFDNVDNILKSEDCKICLEQLCVGEKIVSLKKCQHTFHLGCIKSALIMGPKCPICRNPVKEPQGKSPSGKLIIKRLSIKCGGFEHQCHGSIMLGYELKGDVQKEYHPNPGVEYAGTTRTGYLPDNKDGNDLLKRLKYAWKRGLSFTIGTSLTTGRTNSITWSSIHHKSRPSGGIQAHGFPDESYFLNCNKELDSLGVPPASDLDNVVS